MKPGKIQQNWIDELAEKQPKTNHKLTLGHVDKLGFEFVSALGLLELIYCKEKDLLPVFVEKDGEHFLHSKGQYSSLGRWKDMGLRDSFGTIDYSQMKTDMPWFKKRPRSVAMANDMDIPWEFISAFIEVNPETVFIKSV